MTFPGGWFRADRRVLLFNDDTLDNSGFLRYSIAVKDVAVHGKKAKQTVKGASSETLCCYMGGGTEVRMSGE